MHWRTIQRIQHYAKIPIQQVTMRELLAHTKRPQREADMEHVKHAVWIRDQATVRLAHRLSGFLNLDYVVLCNVRFHEVFQLFLQAFEVMAEFKPIETIDDVVDFAAVLDGAYQEHAELINMMREGYSDLQALLGDVKQDDFLNQVFNTRIGNRLLAEHFLRLHEAHMRGDGDCTGVVNPRCRPVEVINDLAKSLNDLFFEVYGVEPRVIVEGQLDAEFPFIMDHLNFMLQEILKNALRATIETNRHSFELPPVSVEIMKGSFDVTLKICDRGGGMRPEKLAEIWRYGYTSVGDTAASDCVSGGGLLSDLSANHFSRRSIAGYGFGLPLSRVYARYFGGDVVIMSMNGVGTDVYLNINHLSESLKVRE